jgi:hypothetical protein
VQKGLKIKLREKLIKNKTVAMKFLLNTLIIFLFLFNSHAQNKKEQLSYKEFVKLDKYLKGEIGFCLFLRAEGYYSSYLEYPTNVDKFFNFDENTIIPKHIQSVFLNNKKSFLLVNKDSILLIYYDNVLLDSFHARFGCTEISEFSDMRSMVAFFDNQDFPFWDEELANLFRDDIFQIYKKFIGEIYYTVLFPKDTVYIAASERPLVIAYQYDKGKGLSIHEICSSEHTLIENQYTEDLATLAKRYCEQYNLSKIIFSARVVLEEKED